MTDTKNWGDPSAGQLMSVSISVILIWAILTGLVPLEHPKITFPIAGVWFLCTAFYSVMSGLIVLRNGDSFRGTLQTLFGVFFFGGFALTFLVGFFGAYFLNEEVFGELIMKHHGIIPFLPVLPYVFVLLGIILATFGIVIITQAKVIGVSIFVFVIGLLIQGIFGFMGMFKLANFFGGWGIGIAGFIMLYAGIAEILNNSFGKHVLPFK